MDYNLRYKLVHTGNSIRNSLDSLVEYPSGHAADLVRLLDLSTGTAQDGIEDGTQEFSLN
jgi:hypothetical protein